MSNLQDPNEKYNIVRENIIDLLINYDVFVSETHKDLISAAERMTKNTPLFPRELQDIPETTAECRLLKVHRYMYSPIFKNTVDKLTSYIMANTKD